MPDIASNTTMNSASDTPFQALLLRPDHNGYRCALETLHNHDLPAVHPDQDVIVEVEYSSVNYKDALAITARAPIARHLPLVPGIDLAGRVLASQHPDFAPGDRVLATGHALGEKYWGGFSQRARLPGDWLLPLPPGMSSYQAMALGTAGLTAMLCVQRLTDAGMSVDQGPVLVSGASGGVGSTAVALLASSGYRVDALSGRPQHHDYLLQLGAAQVVPRQQLSGPSKPLQKQRWAGAIDSAGGDILAAILAQINYGGSVAACGLAADSALATTVMPFILRGIALLGVDSVQCPRDLRSRAWSGLASALQQPLLARLVAQLPEPIALDQIESSAAALLAGRIRGRVVVKL